MNIYRVMRRTRKGGEVYIVVANNEEEALTSSSWYNESLYENVQLLGEALETLDCSILVHDMWGD